MSERAAGAIRFSVGSSAVGVTVVVLSGQASWDANVNASNNQTQCDRSVIPLSAHSSPCICLYCT